MTYSQWVSLCDFVIDPVFDASDDDSILPRVRATVAQFLSQKIETEKETGRRASHGIQRSFESRTEEKDDRSRDREPTDLSTVNPSNNLKSHYQRGKVRSLADHSESSHHKLSELSNDNESGSGEFNDHRGRSDDKKHRHGERKSREHSHHDRSQHDSNEGDADAKQASSENLLNLGHSEFSSVSTRRHSQRKSRDHRQRKSEDRSDHRRLQHSPSGLTRDQRENGHGSMVFADIGRSGRSGDRKNGRNGQKSRDRTDQRPSRQNQSDSSHDAKESGSDSREFPDSSRRERSGDQKSRHDRRQSRDRSNQRHAQYDPIELTDVNDIRTNSVELNDPGRKRRSGDHSSHDFDKQRSPNQSGYRQSHHNPFGLTRDMKENRMNSGHNGDRKSRYEQKKSRSRSDYRHSRQFASLYIDKENEPSAEEFINPKQRKGSSDRRDHRDQRKSYNQPDHRLSQDNPPKSHSQSHKHSNDKRHSRGQSDHLTSKHGLSIDDTKSNRSHSVKHRHRNRSGENYDEVNPSYHIQLSHRSHRRREASPGWSDDTTAEDSDDNDTSRRRRSGTYSVSPSPRNKYASNSTSHVVNREGGCRKSSTRNERNPYNPVTARLETSFSGNKKRRMITSPISYSDSAEESGEEFSPAHLPTEREERGFVHDGYQATHKQQERSGMRPHSSQSQYYRVTHHSEVDGSRSDYLQRKRRKVYHTASHQRRNNLTNQNIALSSHHAKKNHGDLYNEASQDIRTENHGDEMATSRISGENYLLGHEGGKPRECTLRKSPRISDGKRRPTTQVYYTQRGEPSEIPIYEGMCHELTLSYLG